MFYNKIIEFLKFLKINKTKNNSIIKEIKNESISPSENYNISEAINEAFDSDGVDNKADINSNQIDQLGNEEEIKKESFLVSFFINNPSSIFLGLIILSLRIA